jgi:nuclear receptor subfamily 1 group I
MMILRSILQYDSRHEVWDVPHSTNSARIKTEILKLCSKGNIYEEHEHFIKTFDGKLRTDEKIIMLLCAITLFNPERPYVVHAEVIKLEQV